MRGLVDRSTILFRRVLLSALTLVCTQGCGDTQENAPPARIEIPAEEFRDITQSLMDGFVSGDALAAALRRASPEQGSNLIKLATLPRRAGHRETLALLVGIWNEESEDIPIAAQPIFRVSVASTLHRLDPAECAGCYEYARGLLSANDSDVRSAAALELGELGSSDDVATLRQMIILDDFDVAGSAAAALSAIAEADSIQTLRGLMNDPSVSAEKREMLAQVIAGIESRGAIIESLRAR